MFVPGKLFQPSIVFVGKDRSLPYSGAPKIITFTVTFKCFFIIFTRKLYDINVIRYALKCGKIAIFLLFRLT